MPWVRFEPGVGKVEESAVAVYMRGSKRNETFTQAVDSMTRHDKEKMLNLSYKRTSVREYEEEQYDKDEHETPKI